MSLTIALRTALSGLTAAQSALQVTSDNIANASTPGYSRKTVDLESRRILSQGAGVQIGEIGREVDAFFIRQIRDQMSTVGEYTVRDQFLQQIQSLFGSPLGQPHNRQRDQRPPDDFRGAGGHARIRLERR